MSQTSRPGSIIQSDGASSPGALRPPNAPSIRDRGSPVTQRPPISTSPDVPRMKAGGHRSPSPSSFLRSKADSSPWGGTVGGGDGSEAKGPSPAQCGFRENSPSFGRSGSRASSQSELSRSTSFPRVGVGASAPAAQIGLPRPVPTRRASVEGNSRVRSTSMPLPPQSELNPTDKAAELVQRCIRRWKAKKQGRSMLMLWPSLEQIRSLYFDEAAIAAGARDNPLYSDEALVAREALRTAPLVVDALEYVAEACLGPAADGNTMGRDAYLAMSRKLYLVPRPRAIRATRPVWGRISDSSPVRRGRNTPGAAPRPDSAPARSDERHSRLCFA